MWLSTLEHHLLLLMAVFLVSVVNKGKWKLIVLKNEKINSRERNYYKLIEFKEKYYRFSIHIVTNFSMLRKISDSKNPMQTLTKISSTELGIYIKQWVCCWLLLLQWTILTWINIMLLLLFLFCEEKVTVTMNKCW